MTGDEVEPRALLHVTIAGLLKLVPQEAFFNEPGFPWLVKAEVARVMAPRLNQRLLGTLEVAKPCIRGHGDDGRDNSLLRSGRVREAGRRRFEQSLRTSAMNRQLKRIYQASQRIPYRALVR
jgi:hypothetical protein